MTPKKRKCAYCLRSRLARFMCRATKTAGWMCRSAIDCLDAAVHFESAAERLDP